MVKMVTTFDKPIEVISNAFYAYKDPKIAVELCSYMGVQSFLGNGGIDPMILLYDVRLQSTVVNKLSNLLLNAYYDGGVNTIFAPSVY